MPMAAAHHKKGWPILIKRTFIWMTLLSLLIGRFATRSEAADSLFPEHDNPSNGPGFETIGNMVYVILVLLVIIGMILLLVRFLSKKSKMFGSHQVMNHLTGIQLAQQKSVQLIELGDTLYLLGVGEDIQLIDKITDPDDIARIKEQLDVHVPVLGERSLQWLKGSWLGKKTNRKSREEESASSSSFQEVLYRKMNQANDERRRQMEDWMNEERSGDRIDKL